MTTVYRPARDHRMRIIHVAPCNHIILSAVTLHRGHCDACDPLCEGEPVDIRPLFYAVSRNPEGEVMTTAKAATLRAQAQELLARADVIDAIAEPTAADGEHATITWTETLGGAPNTPTSPSTSASSGT